MGFGIFGFGVVGILGFLVLGIWGFFLGLRDLRIFGFWNSRFFGFGFCFGDCIDFGIVGFIRFGDLWIYGIWDLVDFGDFGILRCLGPHGAGPHGATGVRRSWGATPTPPTGPHVATRGGATRGHRVSEVAGGGPHFTNS